MSTTKNLVIDKVRNVPSPYQSMYIHSEIKAEEYTILGVCSVAFKDVEGYLLVNRNNHFISSANNLEGIKQRAIEYGMAANEVQMKVEITTPPISQEELQQLKNLLDKARTILNLSEANVFVSHDEENKELVLFGECSREGVYRTVSNRGVEDDYM